MSVLPSRPLVSFSSLPEFLSLTLFTLTFLPVLLPSLVRRTASRGYLSCSVVFLALPYFLVFVFVLLFSKNHCSAGFSKAAHLIFLRPHLRLLSFSLSEFWRQLLPPAFPFQLCCRDPRSRVRFLQAGFSCLFNGLCAFFPVCSLLSLFVFVASALTEGLLTW